MSHDDFLKWYEEHQLVILTTASRVVGSENAGDDVAKALLRALKTENYERCETNPLTWFIQAVKSVAATRRRSEKRATAAQRDMKILSQRRKSDPTAPKFAPYSDDWRDDGESADLPQRSRPEGGQRRSWE